MSWKILDASEHFAKYREAWQSINVECNKDNPLLDAKFIEPMLKYFSGGDKVFLAVEEFDKQVQSLALMQPDRFGSWKLFVPSQAAIGPILLRHRDRGTLLKSFKDLFRALPGYALQIGIQKQDPAFSLLSGTKPNFRISTAGHAPTTYINVIGKFEEYWDARVKGVKRNISKTLRLLEENDIHWRLNIIGSGDHMIAAVDEYADIESSGWKGKNNTAIRHNNKQGAFYKEVMLEFSRRNGACVYQLLFDEKVVASLLTLVQNGMQVVLKTTYLESYAQYSPGRFIDYLMLQSAFDNHNVSVVENYTNAGSEDCKWASGCREIYHVNYHRHILYCVILKIYKRMICS